MNLTEQEQLDIRRIRSYYPWRRIWIAESPDKLERIIIAKETSRMATQRAKKGWTVYEVTFDK